jgi:hypothetical protein
VTQGLLRQRTPYVPEDLTDKTGSWCNRDDPACGHLSVNMDAHLTYASGGAIDEAAQEAASRIVPSIPAPPAIPPSPPSDGAAPPDGGTPPVSGGEPGSPGGAQDGDAPVRSPVSDAGAKADAPGAAPAVVAPRAAKVRSLATSTKAVRVVVGKSVTVPVVAYGGGGKAPAFTAKSSKPAVAKASVKGAKVGAASSVKITAKKAGKTTVTVKAGGKKLSIDVRAVGKKVAARGVKIGSVPKGKTLTVGATDRLTAKATAGGVTGAIVKWTSNKPAVLAIDAAGRMTAKKPGAATITATIGSAKTTIRVKASR